MSEQVAAGENEQPAKAHHPATQDVLRFFQYGRRDWQLERIGIFSQTSKLAHSMAERLDGPELTAGLRKLLEARDCFMRAAFSSRRDFESAAESGTETTES